MSERDGGPAFPVTPKYRERKSDPHTGARRTECITYSGMSLRDHFAGQALVGFLASYAHPEAINPPTPEDAAEEAYEYADAMLEAREET